jgi:hypothetical protein
MKLLLTYLRWTRKIIVSTRLSTEEAVLHSAVYFLIILNTIVGKIWVKSAGALLVQGVYRSLVGCEEESEQGS